MEINAPSLYACVWQQGGFLQGGRRALYQQDWTAHQDIPADAATAKEGVADFLMQTAISHTDPDQPHGCMVVLGALHGDEAVGDAVLAIARAQARQCNVIARNGWSAACARVKLQRSVDLQQVAEFYATVQHGMSITARDGATLEQFDQDRPMLRMAAWDRSGLGVTGD